MDGRRKARVRVRASYKKHYWEENMTGRGRKREINEDTEEGKEEEWMGEKEENDKKRERR